MSCKTGNNALRIERCHLEIYIVVEIRFDVRFYKKIFKIGKLIIFALKAATGQNRTETKPQRSEAVAS